MQLFVGLLLGTRWSAIGQCFSLSLVTIPEVFACPSFLLVSKALFKGGGGGGRGVTLPEC